LGGSNDPGGGVCCLLQGTVYRAVYDYDAADDDEADFVEDDRIVNVLQIDDGWVMGVVERTGRKGMIPSNYIEPV